MGHKWPVLLFCVLQNVHFYAAEVLSYVGTNPSFKKKKKKLFFYTEYIFQTKASLMAINELWVFLCLSVILIITK